MIKSERLSAEQYAQNFADIHPPFDNATAAAVEANRCLYCYDAPCTKLSKLPMKISRDRRTLFSAAILWEQAAVKFAL